MQMLKGVKVLSFTHFLQGPSAVQMLADLGAEVIKIEPVTGAYERQWSGADNYLNNVSVFFMLANRNQRSLSINLRSDKGKEAIYRLVKEADVVIENFRPGVMDRLGFGYETLKEMNPRLVYCSCTGYGSDGPYKNRPGQDMLIQSFSGLTTLTGRKEHPPTPVGTAVVDQHGAVLAAFGVLAALYDCQKTGKGQKVESNLLNAAIDLQIEPLSYFLNKGSLWDRSSTGLATRFHQAPYGTYETSNGWITISNTSPDKLADVFEDEALRAYTPKDQMVKRQEIDAIVSAKMKCKTTEEWFERFEKHEIWHSPVNDYEDLVKDPQVEWNHSFLTFDHPDAGPTTVLNHPVRYERHQTEVYRTPPRTGEHTDEILAEYGFSAQEIDEMQRDGVVFNSLKGKRE
jgi:crotonobetainyl-CoA:carnitine CoA-transferase CaiB-like acyl-CoA transferase